ncbi:hypothetical protein [Streptomyces sp. NPDC093149]|uniref:hypothetical protein n=1 Tax=Streptomyces sp. NPDC093149 TaxID=3366031 RepID=UPI0037F22D36
MQRGHSLPVKKKHRIIPGVLMFCVAAVSVCATSIIWPWAAGERARMWVDAIFFAFIVLFAYSVVLGDRTPDDLARFWGGV